MKSLILRLARIVGAFGARRRAHRLMSQVDERRAAWDREFAAEFPTAEPIDVAGRD